MINFLLSDVTFRELNIPISPVLRKEMDIKIKKGEPVPPIITWKGFILMGYEQDDICLKYHKSIIKEEMYFPRRHDAIAWLCRQQLKRNDLVNAARAWLISRLYEALREISKRQDAKEDFQYRQLSPSPFTSPYNKQPAESVAILKQIGEDYHYHKETIRRYVQYGRQIDKLEALVPGTRTCILTGKLTVLMSHIPSILKMPVYEIRKMTDDRNCKQLIPPPEYYKKSPPGKKRTRTNYHLDTAIKQMPKYDPDADLNGLTYTIGAWKKAIARTAEKADLFKTTEAGRESLKYALYDLISEARHLGRMLEEPNHDPL